MHRFLFNLVLIALVDILIASSPGHVPNAGLKNKATVKTKLPVILPFPEEPIQLVRPDPLHKKLIINRENLMLLHNIKDPVATVAVVGKFHSGKSFLMNQLMGKASGFGVGPSVSPQTMGIWMWGRPSLMKLESGLKVNIIFLDTEGFSANNVSENYDAKIFAVSTLISSHLLYNSVKIIDQGDIDYLELLARRTQLFALKSQMTRSKWTKDFNENLLNFPPLIWVVQDFYQDTIDGETPQQWLHRLMKSHIRENEEYEVSLLDIFHSVDCHTLFLPALKRSLLNDLSKATEATLTPEYKEERNDLINKLKRNIKPKEKNSRPINGPELAHLFEVLVRAANEGSLADIPSRWDSFVDKLQQTASEDCIKFYEMEINAVVVDEAKNEPIKSSHLEESHTQILSRSLLLLNQLLHGLDDALVKALNDFKLKIKIIYERTKDMNEKRIKLKMNQIRNSMEISAEEELRKIDLPIKSKTLQETAEEMTESLTEQYLGEVIIFIDVDRNSDDVAQLQKSIANIVSAIKLKNNEEILKLLNEKIETATEQFSQRVGLTNHAIPLKPSALKDLIKETTDLVHLFFEDATKAFQDEVIFQAQYSLLKEKLVAKSDEFNKANEERASNYIRSEGTKFLESFTERTGHAYISLPQNDTELTSRLKIEFNKILRDYSDMLSDYGEYLSYESNLKILKKKINDVFELRNQQNIEAFAREVSKPLDMAKKTVLLSADKYTTVFSLQQFVRSVCLMYLDEGKPKFWPMELKGQIIEQFMTTDEQVKKIIESKLGMYSRIVGFLQWILWLLNLN